MSGILQYALSLDTGGFTSPLSGASSKLRMLKTEAEAGSFGLGGLGAAASGAGVVIAGFSATLAASLAILKSYAEYDGLVRGMKTLEGSADATAARLTRLREVAKVPGLGFEEAVRGDIKLRSVGMSAELSQKAMRSFGNALATVGGGKDDLNGVLTALTQMSAKGKVSAEEINQISERVPQVRAAMQAAFGTADTEALAKSGTTASAFIAGLVDQLAKLPQVTSGAQNSIDNFGDSWKSLKTTASEFFVGISAGFVAEVGGAIDQTRRVLEGLKMVMGIAAPGLGKDDGKLGKGDDVKRVEAEAEAKAKATADDSAAAAKAHNANLAWQDQLAAERRAFLAEEAQKQAVIDGQNKARILASQEQIFASRLTREADLARRIAALQAEGPNGAAAVNATPNLAAKATIADRTAKIVALQKESADLQTAAAEKSTAEAEAATKKAAAEAKSATELAHRHQLSSNQFSMENALLAARAGGHKKAISAAEEAIRLEQLKLQIMEQQGVSEAEAIKLANGRISLEDKAAGKKRRGIAGAGDLTHSIRSLADREKDARLGRDGLSQADRLSMSRSHAYAVGGKPLTPGSAAAELAKAGGASNPATLKRQEKEDATRKDTDPLYRAVKSIEEKFANLASA